MAGNQVVKRGCNATIQLQDFDALLSLQKAEKNEGIHLLPNMRELGKVFHS